MNGLEYKKSIINVIHSMVDKFEVDYCQHLPVRYCCYMECKSCKEIAEGRLDKQKSNRN